MRMLELRGKKKRKGHEPPQGSRKEKGILEKEKKSPRTY
jgi:hypothetical protein